MATVLGFDFGTARIGVAVGETETRLAQPLEVIHGEANALRFARIEALLTEWRPTQLVVGQPSYPDGAPHPMAERCQRFANQLQGRFRLPVVLFDEAFSSQQAEDTLRSASRRLARDWQARKALLDAVAAQSILQAWLEGFHSTATQSSL